MDMRAPEVLCIDVKVRFMGDLPAVTGQRTLDVRLARGATVADLLASLSQTYGEDFRARVFSAPDKLQHTILIFVGGENIQDSGGLAAPLAEGEVELLMLPVICGG